MNTKSILSLLDPKNQNLPEVDFAKDFASAGTIVAPVVKNEEKELVRFFPFLKGKKISGAKGKKTQILHNNQDFYFIGVGPRKELSFRTLRRFYGSAWMTTAGNSPKILGLFCETEWTRPATVGVRVAALDPGILKSKPREKKGTKVLLFHPEFKQNATRIREEMKKGFAVANGKNLARLLGALPPNVLNPQTYAEVILALAKQWKVSVKRVSRNELKDYDLLNAVSAGSRHPAELLVLTLNPKKGATKQTTAVVGKGVCYDSGGYQSKLFMMKCMKEDMAGSAAVLGAIQTMREAGLAPRETTHFLLPLAENMISGNAMRADDVYTAADGKTVEILNTDAEGRLIMADAICYAKKHFKNIGRVYTVATLTSSCISALSDVYTGGVCNDEKLTEKIRTTGKITGDLVHFGPWDMDYEESHSPIADTGNIGDAEREAGWIKAGMFLHRFVPEVIKGEKKAEFCHLDIAASIDMYEKGKPWRKKGFSSGVMVGLLAEALS